MPSIFADRMAVLGTETAFEVLARAKALERQGKNIIHLEIGEPDFDTPQNIKEAAVKALYSGYTHYVPAAGIPELREAIAEYISKTRNIPVDPEEVVVTPGAKPIMFFAILACVNPGEEVLYPNPGFPIYESMINFVGAKPVPIPLKEENDFRLDHEYVKKKITKRTKMIILNSPENPTGGVLTREDLKVIADCIANRDDVIVLSDEIYSRIIYEGTHESIASLPGMKEKTIILDGFSKTYAMTGWRLGYGVMRKDLAEKITQLMVNSNSCTCAFVQMAGIEALKGPQDSVDRMVTEFRKRREVIVEGLNRIKGITCKKPKGAFYVFPNITGTGMRSKELSDFLLNEAGVAVLPGTSFGKYGEGYLRISFANSIENIKEALKRIEKALEKR
ncbi:MAG: pyridoxal phosphate-dependent aminotransferase [Candidatus Bathyarchaeia archaeon]|nr:pyridoxal phosphate-dependent aminotransferase [Candidatus Bathyarchaeota archaeon]